MDLRSSLESFMAEDVGNGDITTESVVDRCPARGQVVVKASGVVAGVEEASEVFRLVGAVPVALVDDGEAVSPGDVILEVRGDSWSLLRAERLALNILSRMSGIATATRRLVDLARAVNPEVRVAATRKTTPGFRYFEKRAVVAGGGDPHRWSLDDAVLIKDNHLAFAGSVARAIARARGAGHSPIEIEVTSREMAIEAAGAGADIIMLDNFTPEEARRVHDEIKNSFLRVTIEVSGGITEENIQRYAGAADVISVGSLTHSVRSLDISMDIAPEPGPTGPPPDD